MRLFPRLVATLSFLLVSTIVHAQTIANIGTFDGEGFSTTSFTGSGAYIDTSSAISDINPGLSQWITGSSNTSGQTGNAIIVTPVSDPVIFFNGISVINGTGSPLLSLTLRLPKFDLGDPRRTQLGFFDLASTAFKDNTGALFSVRYLDPIGDYDGDYAPYHHKTIYSTIHFYQGAGTAKLDPFSTGVLSYSAAYPNTPNLSFLMDNSGGTGGTSTPNPTLFNTDTNPGGGIRAVTPEAPGVVQLLPGLLPLAYVLKRRQLAKKP